MLFHEHPFPFDPLGSIIDAPVPIDCVPRLTSAFGVRQVDMDCCSYAVVLLYLPCFGVIVLWIVVDRDLLLPGGRGSHK